MENKLVKVVYRENYPFGKYSKIINKYKQTYKDLIKNESLREKCVLLDNIEKYPDIELLAHTKDYIQQMKIMAETDLEVAEILACDIIGSEGTINAFKTAAETGQTAFHIGGGFHHAHSDRMGAFDILNDIAIGINYLKKHKGIERLLIIDLDVHHANGSQEIFYYDPNVFQISFHGGNIFPMSGKITEIGEGSGIGRTANLAFKKLSSDSTYLHALERIVPDILKRFRPEFIVYQAGADTLHSDPLGNLSLSLDGLYQRDKFVMNLAEGLPIGIVTGGGYDWKNSYKVHINTLAAFCNLPAIHKSKRVITESRRNMSYINEQIDILTNLLNKHP